MLCWWSGFGKTVNSAFVIISISFMFGGLKKVLKNPPCNISASCMSIQIPAVSVRVKTMDSTSTFLSTACSVLHGPRSIFGLSFFSFWYVSKCYRFLKSVLLFSKPQLNSKNKYVLNTTLHYTQFWLYLEYVVLLLERTGMNTEVH